MEYTRASAEEMAAKLRALPAIEDSERRMTKQAVVKHLAWEIACLQDRGYTLEQVADSLRGIGLDITTPTLKSYLARSKRKQPKRPQAKQPQQEGQQPPQGDKSNGPAGGVAANASKEHAAAGAPKSTRSEFIAMDRDRL